MSNQSSVSSTEKVHTVFVVRDPDGNPRFDDPNNVPQVVLDALTPKDLEYLETLKQRGNH